ncbi:MAG: C45 family autoproteolytic acyltransferase/hydrolase, partial [Spirochaetia bacterium]|nr:C45 family autoproteolytic acyltransferase/hydrolase [Spirochaetia bacterium]
MKEIELTGSYHEMGVQYGRACAKEIKTFAKMAYVMASLSKKPGSQPFNPNLWYILPTLLTHKKEKTKWQNLALEYEKLIKKFHPDAVECMHGIAEGAGLPYIDILSLNIATENILTCSIFGAAGTSTKTKEPLIAMNADEEPMTQKFEVFIDFKPDHGYKFKVTSLAGSLLFNHGMNEKGLALASTLLFIKPPEKNEIRTPMLVLMNILNKCATVAEAKKYFESVPNHSVGSVFYIADSEKFMRIECFSEGRNYEVIENGSLGNTNIATSKMIQPFDAIPFLKQPFNAKL